MTDDTTTTIDNTVGIQERNLLGFGFHDTGNAERIKAAYGHVLRYCPDFKKWVYYNGCQWKKDETGQAIIFAKKTIGEFYLQAVASGNKNAESFAIKCFNKNKIVPMLFLAESDMPIRATDFDKQPYFLNCANGTVDLEKGELRPHRSSDFLMKITNTEYDPEAKHPLFTEFLNKVIGDPEKIDASVKVATQALYDRLALWGAILEQLPSSAPRLGA